MIAAIEEFSGQRWFRLAASGLDVRFFLKGPMLDAGRGKAPASRAALSPLLGEPSRLIAPKQVHGTAILETISDNAVSEYATTDVEADGILFDANEAGKLGLEASLRFADCAPVVVAPSREWVKSTGTPWVLMMHSGYKGTVQNIADAGLEKARARYGSHALDGAWAWVGPCVGGPNYPRDREEWTLRGLKTFRETNVERDGDKVFFDIAGELGLQLMDSGISQGNVFFSGIDTCERPDLCYSYRNGERELRMFLWVRSFL
jgi:copper oxidase (laccase) domain-containing protein